MSDIKSVVKKLRKKYGSVGLSSDEPEIKEYISTGNLALDLILEGGIAWGYISEWSGFSGSGKSLLLQQCLANAQKKYNAVGIVLDRENAWTDKRAEQLGVDTENTIVFKPKDIITVPDAEAALIDTLESLDPDVYKFIMVDSISSFPKEGDRADMGKKAQTLHQLFRKVIPYVDQKTSFHFANQKTYKIGVLFGDNTTTTGGEAPKYYTTYRIQLNDRSRIKDIKRGNEIVGNWINAAIIKTRQGPNFRNINFPFLFKEGIDYYGGYLRMLANRGYVKPNNESEFKSLKQHTVSYKDSKRLSEFNTEEVLKKYPELLHTEYPEYKEGAEDEETSEE